MDVYEHSQSESFWRPRPCVWTGDKASSQTKNSHLKELISIWIVSMNSLSINRESSERWNVGTIRAFWKFRKACPPTIRKTLFYIQLLCTLMKEISYPENNLDDPFPQQFLRLCSCCFICHQRMGMLGHTSVISQHISHLQPSCWSWCLKRCFNTII